MEKKVEYQISSSMNKEILEAIITGETTKSTVEKMKNEVDAIIKANNVHKVLWDIRALKGRFGDEAVYFRARNNAIGYYNIHNAIVDIPENADFVNDRCYRAIP